MSVSDEDITMADFSPSPAPDSDNDQHLPTIEQDTNSDNAEDLGGGLESATAKLEICIPSLSEKGLDPTEYVRSPEESTVVEVLEEFKEPGGSWLQTKFEDGHIEDVPSRFLETLKNGTKALKAFQNLGSDDEREDRHPRRSTEAAPEMAHEADEEASSPVAPSSNATRSTRSRNLLILAQKRKTQAADSSDEEEQSEDELQSPQKRRSSRRTTRSQGIKKVHMLSYQKGHNEPLAQESDEDLVISDLISKKRPRAATRQQRRRRNSSSNESDFGSEQGTRRSGRARGKTNYREPGRVEDDYLEVEEPSSKKARVIHSKEIFPVIDSEDEFATCHNPTCDSCGATGDSKFKGPLVCCQGCSNSYHRECIGYRAAREHLVTKISSDNFVLQCRRCISKSRQKDKTAPHCDRCVECSATGRSCEPFSSLKLVKNRTGDSRDVSVAATPDVEVEQHRLYNATNVLFRCSGCRRAWHFNHLPSPDGTPASEETGNIIQRRLQQYSTDWKCPECHKHTEKIQAIIAWRPASKTARKQPIDEIDISDFNEDERQYLIKFHGQSYFRSLWVPAPWVWGAFPQMRQHFIKKSGPLRLTREAAIEEEWLRVEIVLDVRYTSNVPVGKDAEVDVRRIREVKEALVKWRGLTYDDVVWESPPAEEDTERWEEWRKAYEDYIHGMYVHLPKNVLKKTEKARSTNFDELAKKGQPKYIQGGTLMEYQKDGMNWLYYKWWKGQNAILADEMGLGKTIQIISFLSLLFEEQKLWPFLIVVPHSTVPNWRREIQTWVPDLRVVAYYGADSARKLARKYEMFHPGTRDLKCHIVVTSYSTPVSDSATLKSIPWEALIVDEGQRLKNDESLLYKELTKYKIKQKVLLTGTPLQNNPRELFNLLQFLEPKEMKAADLEEEFGELTSENVPKLHQLIRPFFLRRTKAEVLTFLPPMAEVIVPVSMSTVQKKLYKSILSNDPTLIMNILSRNAKSKNNERAKLNNMLMQLRKCLCHPFLYNGSVEEHFDDDEVSFRNLVQAGSKLTLLNIMLPKLKERGHRVLIFSQFLGMLDIVEDFLDGLGLLHSRLDGSVSTLEKQKRIDAYNAPNSELFAFLLSTRAGGVGINLATADTVIILDPDFNPHQDVQALSRAHRIGQKNKVLVFHLMTRNTAEEKIMQIGKKKLSLDHLIIEKMGTEEDEEEVDVESILKFGARALFEDNGTDEHDIHYDSDSVDKLLDRSQMEQTRTTGPDGDQATENAFSFAKVWANEKGALEEGLGDRAESEDKEVDVGFWEKVLREREEEARLEAEQKKMEYGRGQRRRTTVYNETPGQDIFGDGDNLGDEDGDTDFMADPDETESEGEEPMVYPDELAIIHERRLSDKPIAQSRIVGPPPLGLINQNSGTLSPHPGPYRPPHPDPYRPVPSRPDPRQGITGAPQVAKKPIPPHPNGGTNHNRGTKEFRRIQLLELDGEWSVAGKPDCKVCNHAHSPGQCRLRMMGIEFCPLCEVAHVGKGPVCPHFGSEGRINEMMLALRESKEDPELVAQAKAYLRGRKGGLAREKRRRSSAITTSALQNAPPVSNGN